MATNPVPYFDVTWDDLKFLGVYPGPRFERNLDAPKQVQFLDDPPDIWFGGPIISNFGRPWPSSIGAVAPPRGAQRRPTLGSRLGGMVGGMRRASVRERIFTSVPRLGPRPVADDDRPAGAVVAVEVEPAGEELVLPLDVRVEDLIPGAEEGAARCQARASGTGSLRV